MNSEALSLTESRRKRSNRARLMHTEKRTSQRYTEIDHIPVSFYNSGKLYSGKLCNLSAEGVCMELPVVNEMVPDIHRGKNMECYVQLSEERTKFSGKVRWTHIKNSRMTCGVVFKELMPSEKDPFTATIRKICQGEGEV